jgi:hypothetical protein
MFIKIQECYYPFKHCIKHKMFSLGTMLNVGCSKIANNKQAWSSTEELSSNCLCDIELQW